MICRNPKLFLLEQPSNPRSSTARNMVGLTISG